MRQVHDGLMLHNVHVFDPSAEETTGSYQKWNFVVPAGAFNFTYNHIEKIRVGSSERKIK